MNDCGKTRVLHIVGGMNRGGVETWLMHVLRHIDKERFEMDFLVHTLEPCAYDNEIRAWGSKIFPCLHPQKPFRYAIGLRRVLKAHGRYDVLHSHVHHFSGFTLALGRLAGVPLRIAHSHLDSRPVDSAGKGLRRVYLKGMRKLIRMNATSFLAASQQAGEALFGSHWDQDQRSRIAFYGIDLKPFRNASRDRSLRYGLGLPEQAFVVGHVGAFRRQKNHSFLLDISAELVQRDPQSRLLLVGDGPLRMGIEKKARAMGLHDRMIFAGSRSDVPDLMTQAMDAYVMPSLYEGLGIVCIEAQAAGLPLVISDRIPPEVDVLPGLVQRVSLSAPPSFWAEKLLQGKGKKLVDGAGARAVEESPFSILKSVASLEKIYEGKKHRHP